jgi:AcrR family transcriptional regulator
MTQPALTRRERVRLQTLGEIKQHALAQVAEGGVGALSLNAIAKAMGMSGPAIYRYFDSRDALLAALVTDGYGELADAVLQAAAHASRRAPARRLTAAAEAYRGWARANPYRYELLFSVRPATYSDPTEAIAAIQPAMVVVLEQLGEIAGAAGAPAVDGKLERQLVRWAGKRGGVDAPSPHVLKLGVLTWSRLHGIVSLELAGILGDMELDAGLLLADELDTITADAAPRTTSHEP